MNDTKFGNKRRFRKLVVCNKKGEEAEEMERRGEGRGTHPQGGGRGGDPP